RASDDVLVLNTMFFADEVRSPRKAVDSLPGDRKLPKRELDIAVSLIEQLTTSWDPQRYHDTYRERVLALVEAKASGEEPSVEPAEKPAENVVDLVSALRESIERAKSGRSKRGATGHSRKSDGKQNGGKQKGRAKSTSSGKNSSSSPDSDLSSLSKQELYERAGDLKIRGRSKMSASELREAVGEAS